MLMEKKAVRLFACSFASAVLMMAACLHLLNNAFAESGLTVSADHAAAASVLDLSHEGIWDIDDIKSRIAANPAAKIVILGDAPLSMENRKDLMQSFPAMDFEWSFSMYGIPVSSADSAVDLGKNKITKIEELMDYLDCLPNLKKVDMYASKLKEKQILALAQRYPDIRFGWTLVVCTFPVRTDALVFSMHRRGEPLYKSEDFRLLRFCPDIVALDLGHNRITDLTFLTSFPKLKILILADNKITDLSPLKELKDLEYLELFMNKITDVTPLAELEKLLDLNLCFNKVTDASPLLQLKRLERLWISRNELEQEQKEILRSGLPECSINFTAKMATWDGWRTHERFYIMRDILNTGIYRDWE